MGLEAFKKDIENQSKISLFEELPLERDFFDIERESSDNQQYGIYFYNEEKTVKEEDIGTFKNILSQIENSYDDLVPVGVLDLSEQEQFLDTGMDETWQINIGTHRVQVFGKCLKYSRVAGNKNYRWYLCKIYSDSDFNVIDCVCRIENTDSLVFSKYRKYTGEEVDLVYKKIRDENWANAKEHRKTLMDEALKQIRGFEKISRRNWPYRDLSIEKTEERCSLPKFKVVATRNASLFEKKCEKMLNGGYLLTNFIKPTALSPKKRNQAFVAVFEKKPDFRRLKNMFYKI